ncbi:MAG: thiamine pyrophosphate-binding protein [Cellvibrionaceae bacterium]|nr:thiamine pyrophosphate-binding protein [Cellvibrionaceae bacterium]
MKESDFKNEARDAPVELPEGTRTGAKAAVEVLQSSGVDLIFGYSGGGTGTIINEIVDSGIKEMNARSELSSTWMSYGYNRVKGYAASACVYHCVGTLHCSPAIYASVTDSAPLLVIGVSLDSALDFREGLQDSSQMFPSLKPISKYCRKVVSSTDVPLAIRQALLSAGTGRPGPSVLDMAHQSLQGITNVPSEPLVLPEPPAASEPTLNKIFDMIKDAERPVLFVGGGVHLGHAEEELRQVAEALQIPVLCTSWGGRGVISDNHELFGGVVGAFGWNSANELIQKSDLWIAVGTTFSQMTTGAWNLEKPKNVVHVDVDPNQLGKIFQPTVGVTAHSKVFLQQMVDRIERDGIKAKAGREDLKELPALKQEWHDYHEELCGDGGSEDHINQYYLIHKMAESFPSGTIMVGDSGGHAHMLFRSFNYKEVTPMAEGTRYQSLGAGLPVAIGAKLAAPERTVVCYHGDGGFYYDAMELSTLAERKIKVIVVIDNNRCLLANRASFSVMGMKNPWCELPETTDFVDLANAMGLKGERVTKPEDLDAAFERANASEESYLIDVWTDPNTRTKRAIRNVIPILSDRKPTQNAARHTHPPLDGSWPS